MGPIWGRQDPGGPHVSPMNLSIWVIYRITSASPRSHNELMEGSLPHINDVWCMPFVAQWDWLIKSPQSGLTSCFQLISAASTTSAASAASAAAKTYATHIKTVCAKPYIFGNNIYMGLVKCTGWPFHGLDPRSWLWHWLTKICLSAQ